MALATSRPTSTLDVSEHGGKLSQPEALILILSGVLFGGLPLACVALIAWKILIRLGRAIF
jgi:hypothetical protein